MDDVTRRLSAHLEEQASRVQPDGSGPEEAMARGTWYRRRRVGLGVTVVGLVGIAALATLTLRPTQTDVDPLTGGAVAPAEGVAAPESVAAGEFEWRQVDRTLVRTSARGTLYSSDGTYYALSTAPGVKESPTLQYPDLPRAIYRSDDGATWSSQVLSDDLWAGDLAEYGGRLYVVGTGPATAEVDGAPAAAVSTSLDAGKTWSSVRLDLEATPPSGFPDVHRFSSAHIASAPAGVVAVVHTRFSPDPTSLVPAEYITEYSYPVVTETGVEVYDYSALQEAEEACEAAWQDARRVDDATGDTLPPESGVEPPPECLALGELRDVTEPAVSFSATWADLGIVDSGALSYPEAFWSADGSSFERVSAPLTGSSLHGLYGGNAGFLSLAWQQSTTDAAQFVASRSTDGRTWTTAELPGSIIHVMAVGEVAGSWVVVGSSTAGTRVWTQGEGLWAEVDVDALLGPAPPGGERWIQSAGVGPLGVAIAMADVPDVESVGPESMNTRLLYSADLSEWTMVEAPELMSDVSGGFFGQIIVGADELLVDFTGFDGLRSQHVQLIGTPTG